MSLERLLRPRTSLTLLTLFVAAACGRADNGDRDAIGDGDGDILGDGDGDSLGDGDGDAPGDGDGDAPGDGDGDLPGDGDGDVPGDGDGDLLGDGDGDVAPPVMCGDLMCGRNQECSPGMDDADATCECREGFEEHPGGSTPMGGAGGYGGAPPLPMGGMGGAFGSGDCIDIDECYLQIDDCVSGDRCENTFGSYECYLPASCLEAIENDPRAESGIYMVSSPVVREVYCDMETDGGGFLDVVQTFHLDGADVATLAAEFFAPTDGETLTVGAEVNDSLVPGILLTSSQGGNQQGYFLNPLGWNVDDIRISWRFQGADQGGRCNNGNWIPLNGPGFDGGSNSYLVSCLSGLTCIQGRPENKRDLPIAATYSIDGIAPDTILAWSGSAINQISSNCARDPEIPSGMPALFIDQLLIR